MMREAEMLQGIAMAEAFGKRLKKLRERAGITQEALARAANLSTSSVSKLEQRDLDPSWSTVLSLAKALGITTDEFASDEVSGPTDEPAPKKKPKGKN